MSADRCGSLRCLCLCPLILSLNVQNQKSGPQISGGTEWLNSSLFREPRDIWKPWVVVQLGKLVFPSYRGAISLSAFVFCTSLPPYTYHPGFSFGGNPLTTSTSSWDLLPTPDGTAHSHPLSISTPNLPSASAPSPSQRRAISLFQLLRPTALDTLV